MGQTAASRQPVALYLDPTNPLFLCRCERDRSGSGGASGVKAGLRCIGRTFNSVIRVFLRDFRCGWLCGGKATIALRAMKTRRQTAILFGVRNAAVRWALPPPPHAPRTGGYPRPSPPASGASLSSMQSRAPQREATCRRVAPDDCRSAVSQRGRRSAESTRPLRCVRPGTDPTASHRRHCLGPNGVTGPRDALEGKGTSEVAPEVVRQAVGGGCRSGWGRLVSVTNVTEVGTCRQGDSGWA